jgi:hypothetical protein
MRVLQAIAARVHGFFADRSLPIEPDMRDEPLRFSEIVTAASVIDFGAVPLEWSKPEDRRNGA